MGFQPGDKAEADRIDGYATTYGSQWYYGTVVSREGERVTVAFSECKHESESGRKPCDFTAEFVDGETVRDGSGYYMLRDWPDGS